MDQEDKLKRIDGIKWWISIVNGLRVPVPLCPQHNLRLEPKPGHSYYHNISRPRPTTTATELECAEGPHSFHIPRQFGQEISYVINKADALIFEKMKVQNFDDELIPVASEELKDSSYWIRSKITDSKAGTRLIIWAGDRSKHNKTQLFIEPELKRLSFDQNDDHPTEVFAKVEVTFADNIKASIKDEE